MNPVLPVFAGVLPLTMVVLMMTIRLNRVERRRAAISKHVSRALRGALQRGVGDEPGMKVKRPKLAFERKAFSYRGYVEKC